MEGGREGGREVEGAAPGGWAESERGKSAHRAAHVIVVDGKRAQVGEPSQLRGELAREEIAVQVQLLQCAHASELRGQLSTERIGVESHACHVAKAAELRRQRAAE
jgi:hypothetical protein